MKTKKITKKTMNMTKKTINLILKINNINAKDIGTLYIVFPLLTALVTCFSMLIRLELSGSDVQYISSNQLYDNIITALAIIMIIFFMVMPALIGGFGNFLFPSIIGGPDMSFPSLNDLICFLKGPNDDSLYNDKEKKYMKDVPDIDNINKLALQNEKYFELERIAKKADNGEALTEQEKAQWEQSKIDSDGEKNPGLGEPCVDNLYREISKNQKVIDYHKTKIKNRRKPDYNVDEDSDDDDGRNDNNNGEDSGDDGDLF